MPCAIGGESVAFLLASAGRVPDDAAMEPYRLHYAPDNAALCVRLGLLALPVPFRTALVDCAMWAQDSAAYRRLHPAGLLAVAQAMDARPATAAAARAEGPGTRPFSAPRLPDPPEWSAT